ncbi:MAG: DUF2182 domain-containing protein [Gemmatirosa sp.]|nr:DUF2182 domain-containing protein [Gemmatirosa sp.]
MRSTRYAFVATATLLFAGSVAATVAWCASMSAMGGTPMPGGWTLSMAWTRMPGQTSLGAAASFLGMWDAMTVAMMLPSLAPVLWRHRESGGGAAAALVGAGYFLVWTAVGAIVFPLGAGLAAIALHAPPLARAMPLAAGVVVAVAGAYQLSARKARHLAGCHAPPAGRHAAVRYGVRVGLRCVRCCGNLMAVTLAVGMMDVRVMVVVGVAITAERLVPAGAPAARVARVTGAVAMGAGLLLLGHAA